MNPKHQPYTERAIHMTHRNLAIILFAWLAGVLLCPTPVLAQQTTDLDPSMAAAVGHHSSLSASFPALVNGNFDLVGGVNWVQTTTSPNITHNLIVDQSDIFGIHAYSPPNLVWLGGTASVTDDLYQQIYLPIEYPGLQLSYRYWVESGASTCEGDLFQLRLLLVSSGQYQTLERTSLCRDTNTNGWQHGVVSLNQFVGQEVRIHFVATIDDDEGISSFFLDSVQLCDNSNQHPCGERTYTPLDDIVDIAAGGSHTCALTSSGGVKCWGRNNNGQLGDGTTTDRAVPVDVVGLAGRAVAIAAGDDYTCALSSAGGVKCWGTNDSGQLGDGTTANKNSPVDVVGLSDGIARIAAGGFHTCAVTFGGALKCWGGNNHGQLGVVGDSQSTPVDVTNLSSSVTNLSLGGAHTCVLTVGGGIQCWGLDLWGAVGDGTGLSSGMAEVAAGGLHTCALTNSGGGKCWGWNYDGQLGDGTRFDSGSPVDVAGLNSGLKAIAAGEYHTCALTNPGGAKCWGANRSSQLGDGTTTNRNAPVDVVALPSGMRTIVTGGGHTCALTDSNGVKCWGDNDYGALGDGTTIDRSTPVDVLEEIMCHALTLSHSGNGSDPVATPASSDGCNDGEYVSGQDVALTAGPAAGWRVAGWWHARRHQHIHIELAGHASSRSRRERTIFRGKQWSSPHDLHSDDQLSFTAAAPISTTGQWKF